jgi:hypothetical protein
MGITSASRQGWEGLRGKEISPMCTSRRPISVTLGTKNRCGANGNNPAIEVGLEGLGGEELARALENLPAFEIEREREREKAREGERDSNGECACVRKRDRRRGGERHI